MNTTKLQEQRELKGRRILASPSSTVWGYLRHELLYLGFALMEIALLTPIVLVILGWARYWPPFQVGLWLVLVMLLPFNLIRLMSILKLDLKRQRRLLLLGLVVTIFLSWRLLLYNESSLLDFGWMRQFFNSLGEGGNLLWTRDLSVFLVTAFAWWRGIKLSIRYPEINNVGLRLRLGGLIFLPLIIWFSSAFLENTIVPFVLLFFLSSLVVISLVRAENIEQERSGMAATLNARWFATVAAAALLIIITGGVLAALLSGESLFLMVGWLAPLWRSLQFGATVAGVTLFEITYPVLEFFALIIQWLAGIMGGILGQISAGLRESNLFATVESPILPTPAETVEVVGPALAGKATTAVVMIALLVLIALALARTYQKATFAARDNERSRTMAQGDDEPGLGRRVLERLGLLRQWRAAASVRRIYKQMCRTAGAAGYPRLGTETPYEYLPTLTRVWAYNAAETQIITEAFVRVRYGEAPETEEELEVIRAAWRQLEAAEPNRRETPSDQSPTLAKRE